MRRRDDPRHLVVGHINKAHGIRGELHVLPLTDHPEGTFVPGVVVRLGGGSEPDPGLRPLEIESVRPFKDGFLVAFTGVTGRSEAELLRGYDLYRPLDELVPLGEGELFYHELRGMEVYTVEGERLGTVREVYELSPTDLLEVRGESREYMIPFLAHLVVGIDPEARRLTIDPPDGLLDL